MKTIATSMYHKVLRVSLVVCALLLVFESGIVSPITRQLSVETHQYMANAVGVGAAVNPTELNTITAELTQERLALEAREQMIAEREIEIGLTQGQSTNETAIYLLSGALFVLLILTVLNYVLDYMRARPVSEQSRRAV